MPDTYDHITLMCRLKAAQRRNKELESGERYIQLEELHQKEYNVYEHKIEKLKKELADAHKETIRVRNYWFQVLEDMLREFEKAQKRSAQELRKMEIRALNAEKQREDALDKAAVFRHQFYEAASRLEEEQGKNLKLRAQINRDYENSSIPSSKAVRRKKITNNREKTGRRPGGQPGHKGHCRKRQEPTQPVILLPPPEEVLEDCAFKKTARTIVKQMVQGQKVKWSRRLHTEGKGRLLIRTIVVAHPHVAGVRFGNTVPAGLEIPPSFRCSRSVAELQGAFMKQDARTELLFKATQRLKRFQGHRPYFRRSGQAYGYCFPIPLSGITLPPTR